MTIQLILDQESVASSEGVSFHLNPATKSPHNPVVGPGRPEDWDGLRIAWPGTVLYDAQDDVFRLWYSGLDAVQTAERKWNFGYAESKDGVHWTKPNLGMVEQDGRPTNRIAEPEGAFLITSVTEDPAPESPAKRFVAIWLEYLDWVNPLWRKRLGYSPDGVTWDWSGPTVYEEGRGMYDVSQLLIDRDDPDPDFRYKFFAQAQYWPTKGGVQRPEKNDPFHPFLRCIGFLHGAAMDDIREPDDGTALALAPIEGIDDELHFAGVQKAGQNYVMIYESDRFAKDPLNGDLRLAISADGRSFRRVHATSSLVPTGPHGTWDENILVTTTAGLVEYQDEVRIYYFGAPDTFRAWPPAHAVSGELKGSLYYPTHLGFASLPLDRYGYAYGKGSVTTHPIQLGASGLWVNGEGDMRITAGESVGRLGRETLRTHYRKVEWEGKAPSGSHSLRIDLGVGAKVYSVRSDVEG